MEVTTLQKTVAEFVVAHNLEAPVETRLLDLLSELGELSKEVLKSTGYGQRSFNPDAAWADELGDVLFALICLANSTNLDLASLLDNTLQKYQRRLAERGRPDSGQ